MHGLIYASLIVVKCLKKSVIKNNISLAIGLMQSYPNCRAGKETFIPDIRQLARIFEEWGFDFRVILLERNPEAIAVSSLRRKFDRNLLSQCKMYLFSIKALLYQIKALDRRFIGGAISIERSLKENLKSADKLMSKSLNWTPNLVRKLFKKYKDTRRMQCIDSPHEENQTELANCRSDLYNEFFSYRKLFDTFFYR